MSLRRSSPGFCAPWRWPPLAGCGEREEPDRVAPVPVATETRRPAAEAAEIVAAVREPRGGFAIGLPRGWKASGDAEGSTVRSFDKLVVLTISPDRSPDGLTVGADEYAERAARALPGYRNEIEPSMGAAVRPQLRGRRGASDRNRQRDRSRSGDLGDRPQARGRRHLHRRDRRQRQAQRRGEPRARRAGGGNAAHPSPADGTR